MNPYISKENYHSYFVENKAFCHVLDEICFYIFAHLDPNSFKEEYKRLLDYIKNC